MSIEDKDQFLQMVGELNGGTFLEQIVTAFKATALGTVVHGDKGKKGEVTIKFSMSRIGETTQVAVRHTLDFTQPTSRGKRSETGTTETPLYVGRTGVLTVLPDTQQPLFAEGDTKPTWKE